MTQNWTVMATLTQCDYTEIFKGDDLLNQTFFIKLQWLALLP